MLVLESRAPVGSSARIMLGIVHQRSRDGHALLLAAGKLARLMVFPVRQVPRRAGLHGPLVPLLGGRIGIHQRQFDILRGAGARQQVELLNTNPIFLLRISASWSRPSFPTLMPSSL